jgi:hypothetical protein
MAKKVYQLVYKLRCLELEFIRTNWRVFGSQAEAEAYGRSEEAELNEGLPPCERASDGYFYTFWYADAVEEVDGHRLLLGVQG